MSEDPWVGDDTPDMTEMEKMTPGSPTSSKSKGSFFHRSFKKLEQGSIRGSIFTMLSTAIGAGCLSLPKMMSESGIILELIFICFAAAVAYLSIISLCRAADHYDIYEFSPLVTKALGKPWGITIDVIVMIYIYGTVIGYQILVGVFVPSIFGSFEINFNHALERELIMIFANVLITTPLALLRNLSALRFASLVSVFSLLFITLLLIIEMPMFSNHYEDVKVIDFNILIFQNYSITLYAYLCHCNIPIIYKELKDRSIRRISKAASRAVAFEVIIYIFLTLFGYLSVPHSTPEIITQRSSPNISSDWAMVMGRVCFTITLILAIPINTPPFRIAVVKTIFRKEGVPSRLMHVCITIFLLYTCLIIAIFYPNIIFLFGFLGGFCAQFIVIIIPGLLDIKISGKPMTSPVNMVKLSIITVIALCGFTGVIISIIQLA